MARIHSCTQTQIGYNEVVLGKPQQKQPTDENAARQRVERMVNRYALRGPYQLNPDPTTVEYDLSGLTHNFLAHGKPYCPCREVTGNPDFDRSNICPCPQRHSHIYQLGYCECGIFVSNDFARSIQEQNAASATKEV
jgi:ferredoxin-thioredoxin reductase catalytic subunit